MTQAEQQAFDEARSTGSISYFTIFALGFAIFAAIAIVAGSLGLQWRSWLPGAEGVKSSIGGVKAAVYTFMSHLE
jgi:light-harvesting complex 1 beta chain